MDFKDKVVLITGAAGAIGKVVSKRFQEEGALLSLIDIDQEKLTSLELEYLSHSPSDTLFTLADARDEQQVQQYVQKTVDIFGNIDVLVHCIGISGEIALASEQTIKNMKDIYDINVITAFLNYKAVLPFMQKQGSGSIVFISGIYGSRGVPYFSAYSTACHALLGFMRSASLECINFGIRLNAVSPSPTNSPMMHEIEKKLSPDPQLAREQIVGLMPYGRYVEPEEIVETILFLASDKANYTTGSNYRIDGGMTTK